MNFYVCSFQLETHFLLRVRVKENACHLQQFILQLIDQAENSSTFMQFIISSEENSRRKQKMKILPTHGGTVCRIKSSFNGLNLYRTQSLDVVEKSKKDRDTTSHV